MVGIAGTVMVRHDSHREHADYWANRSRMDPTEKAAMGDFYIFKPEVHPSNPFPSHPPPHPPITLARRMLPHHTCRVSSSSRL